MTNTLNGRKSTQVREEDNQQIVTSQKPTNKTDDWSDVTKESVDSLPQVWTRGLLYFLVIFVSIVLPWSMLFKVDETGTAKGKLEPKGRTVKLDAEESGTVEKIFVNQGDSVKEGQLLLTLESKLVQSELRQIKDKLEGQKDRQSQLKLSKNQWLVSFSNQQQKNQSQKLEKQAQIDQARQNIQGIKNTFNLRKEEKLAQVNQARKTLENSKNVSKLAENSLVSARRELQRYTRLFNKGVIPKIQVVDKQDTVREKQKLYEQSKSDIKQAQLGLAEQESSYQRIIKQGEADIEQAQLRLKEQLQGYQSLSPSGKLSLQEIEKQQHNLDTEIASLSSEIAQTKEQIDSLKIQLDRRKLKATVNGTIFELPIKKAGAVVQPGTMLTKIAPQGSPLIMRARIPTSESGSLQTGLPVKLKFDAYPFQDYGIVEGELVKTSPNTIEMDTANGRVAAYVLEIALDKHCIKNGHKCTPLRPGDTATAEVIVRQRRIIDFLLDPFKKLQNGGLKL